MKTTRQSHQRPSLSTLGAAAAVGLALFGLPREALTGAFIFAGETNGVAIVTHPTGYTGAGGTLSVSVCVDPTSVNADAMEVPVRNIVKTWNDREVTTGNLLLGSANDVPASSFDFESVALHEMGHCIGLAHVNLASESGLGGADQNYTKSTDGANGFDLGIGADAVRGSRDDQRGDDVNLHWFRAATNDPFGIAATVDSTTYSRDLANLPGVDSFATNADRAVSTLLGLPASEASMQQGTFNDEAQRTLVADDVATLRYAMSGVDELAGTADDYAVRFWYAGKTNSCDIVIDFDNAQTGFAVCQTSGSFINATHVRITSANIYFNSGFNWHFNQVLNDGLQYFLADAVEQPASDFDDADRSASSRSSRDTSGS